MIHLYFFAEEVWESEGVRYRWYLGEKIGTLSWSLRRTSRNYPVWPADLRLNLDVGRHEQVFTSLIYSNTTQRNHSRKD